MAARPLAFAFFTALVFAFVTLARAQAQADCDGAVRPGSILYATDRQPLADAQLFSGERGKTAARQPILSYGVVSLPVDRAHLQPCSSQAAFMRAAGKRFASAHVRRALVYVHGYYRTFVASADAAIRVQARVKFQGPVVLYSWPSKVTSRFAYVNDETNATWAVPHFVDLLARLERSYPKLPISFVSHSMGARLSAAGMQFVRQSVCTQCLGRSAFFAPDVDSDTLRDEFAVSGLCASAPVAAPASAALVALYVSNRDVALRTSQQLHGHQRAGQAGNELILCSGVDTIDVGGISGADRAGHTYHVYPQILKDTAAAFAGTVPAYPGRKLKRASRPGGSYFELEP